MKQILVFLKVISSCINFSFPATLCKFVLHYQRNYDSAFTIFSKKCKIIMYSKIHYTYDENYKLAQVRPSNSSLRQQCKSNQAFDLQTSYVDVMVKVLFLLLPISIRGASLTRYIHRSSIPYCVRSFFIKNGSCWGIF